MTERFSNYPESNPFSTRFTAPGKTPFFFERSFLHRMKARSPGKFEDFFVRALGAGDDIRGSVCVQFLIDEFESRSRRGQIVGAHGTGKSTLACVLKEALSKRGYEVFSWTLNDQRAFLPDVFWLELQQFLQQAPAFLPTKCLLPPPIVSRQDYRSTTVERDDDDALDDVRIDDEFRVGDSTNEATSTETGVASPSTAPTEIGSFQRKAGFLGFNSAGNFGFNATRGDVGTGNGVGAGVGVVRDDGRDSNSANEPQSSFESNEISPFPGVAPPNETRSNAESEPRREETPTSSAESPVSDDAPIPPNPDASSPVDASFAEQKRLAIPLPADYDFEKNRRLFEKKVVCFDGFEQLSYVNRIVLRTFCRMNRLGLLLTTHTPAIGIPVLFRTSPSIEILRQLLTYLLDDFDMTPNDADLDYLLKSFNGDVREILFSLYDAFESYRWSPRDARQRIVRRRPR